MKFVKKHPFLTYGLIALVVHTFVIAFGAQYDDSGLGALVVTSSPFWAVIYWVPSEIIFTINNGVAIKGHEIFSAIIGLGLCLFADFLLNTYRGRNSDRLVNT